MHVHLYRINTGSRHWYAQVYVGGERHRFTCRTADKSTARAYAMRRARDLQDGCSTVLKVGHTLRASMPWCETDRVSVGAA